MTAPGHVLITGAAGAIGAALARAMRAAWPTATLALVDREEAPLQRLVGELSTGAGDAHAFVADLRDLSALPGLVERVQQNGPIDGLVNCAGIMRVQQVQSWKWDDAQSLITIDLLAPLRLQDLVVHALIEQKRPASKASDNTSSGSTSKVSETSSGLSSKGSDRTSSGSSSMGSDRTSSGSSSLGSGRTSSGSSSKGSDRTSSGSSSKGGNRASSASNGSDRTAAGSSSNGGGRASDGGAFIVNIASMAGRVPLRGCAYYGAAKAGLAMASEIARADLEQHGIRVVTVYPGPVKSALEAGARADYGGGGLFGRFAPTGDPNELASRIMHAIAHDEPRVIYPRLYGVGWTAPNLSSWIALSYGPPPVS